MRRSKAAYMNFVCPYCFHKLHECTCEYFPPWELLFIDDHIQSHVRILNEKGYTTNGSCEGHYTGKPGANTAICFVMDYPEIVTSEMPEGFKYNKAKRAIWHFYDAKLNRKDFESEKVMALIRLLEWCRGLPENPKVINKRR